MKPNTSREADSERVSVVIPAYNGERYLAEALDSVFNQTEKPYEVIVVDDGSTDTSSEILDSYGDRIVKIEQANSGTASARNRGVGVATGDLIAFLDQDDYWHENKLEKQSRIFRDTPDVQIVWGSVQQFFSPELSEDFKKRYRCPNEPVPGYLPSALLIRSEAFHKVGPFDSKWKIGEWADWYARSTQAGLRSDRVFDVVAYRRIHGGNKGITMVEDRREYVSLIRENLKRKRAQ